MPVFDIDMVNDIPVIKPNPGIRRVQRGRFHFIEIGKRSITAFNSLDYTFQDESVAKIRRELTIILDIAEGQNINHVFENMPNASELIRAFSGLGSYAIHYDYRVLLSNNQWNGFVQFGILITAFFHNNNPTIDQTRLCLKRILSVDRTKFVMPSINMLADSFPGVTLFNPMNEIGKSMNDGLPFPNHYARISNYFLTLLFTVKGSLGETYIWYEPDAALPVGQ